MILTQKRTLAMKRAGILSQKQHEFIDILVSGEFSKVAACKAAGISYETHISWQKDDDFIKEYAKRSKVDRPKTDVAGLIRTLKSGKIPKVAGKLSAWEIEASKRGLKDFHYFREHFLGRKSWKCQITWIDFIQKHERASIECPGRHGKSLMISVDYATWCIVRDRNVLIGLYSKSSGLVEKWVAGIKRNLSKTKLTRAYGTFKPENPERWNRQELEVIRPNISDDDAVHPTVTAAGITSDIFGTKYNVLILDDICGKDNTATDEQRQKVVDIVTEALMPATQTGPDTPKKIINIGTPMHPYDFLHWCKNNGDFNCLKNTAVSWETKKVLAPESVDFGTFTKITKLKRDLGTRAFNKRFMCHAVLDDEMIFQDEWFRLNYAKNWSYGDVPADYKTVVTVDPAVSSRRGSSNLAIAVIAFQPTKPDRQLVDFFDDKLRVESQAGRIVDYFEQYDADLVIIEKNACQAYLKTLVVLEGQRRGINVPIEMTFTGANKRSSIYDTTGVDRLAPIFERGNYRLPYALEADRARTGRLVQQLSEATLLNVSDMLMAMWFAEQYIDTFSKKVIRLHQRGDLPWYLKNRQVG